MRPTNASRSEERLFYCPPFVRAFFRPQIGVHVDYDDFWMIVEYLTKVIKFITEVLKLVELLKKLRKRK